MPKAPLAGLRFALCQTRILVPTDRFHTRQPGHRIAREEIFGPVLSVLTFRTPAGKRPTRPNNTPYGLSAGVWTEKGSLIPLDGEPAPGGRGVGEHLQPLRPASPFGGYQESGFGREGGRHGLESYLAH